MHIYIECLFCTIKRYLHFRSKEISSTDPKFKAKLQRKQEKTQYVSNHIYFYAVNTLLLYYVIQTLCLTTSKELITSSILHLYFTFPSQFTFQKYTHISSLMGTIPWDRRHIGVLLLVQCQKRLPKSSCGQLEDETKLTLFAFKQSTLGVFLATEKIQIIK